jgi:hypothetical protein
MVEIPLTLALSPMERGQELLRPSPLGRRAGDEGKSSVQDKTCQRVTKEGFMRITTF